MTEEKFSLDDEVIDLEWTFSKGHKPPKGRKYRYKVDGNPFISPTETMTGREILVKAGKDPLKTILRQKLKGNWITIKNDDVVDFTEKGVEKFKTLPNDQTEGENSDVNQAKSLRRDFALLEEDEEFLIGLGLDWEAAQLADGRWVFIHGHPVPEGYNVRHVLVGAKITPGYPTAQLDMLYFYPALQRIDGQPINNLSPVAADGKIFQQWSRHRTGVNPWRPGIDNLSTHIPLAEAWLSSEFIKRPTHAISA
ncbi:MAG: multiubiquitin domain-containing protein [Chitinophagaceae bacterium]|nr:multiubiquitin domain-containing protein [Chitinophagaceae bacterium]